MISMDRSGASDGGAIFSSPFIEHDGGTDHEGKDL